MKRAGLGCLAAAIVAASTACGPSAEEQADVAVVSSIEALTRTDAKEVAKREELVAKLQALPAGSPAAQAAQAACVRYYQTQIDLRKTLDLLETLAPKDKGDVEPTLEILANLSTAEDLQKKAAAELDPCTEATGTLRVKTKYGN